jgi:enterobactin synthetase component D
LLLSPHCRDWRMAAADLTAFGPPRSAARVLEVAFPDALDSAVTKRQLEFVAGRVCAARALRLAGCAAIAELPVGANRAPVWPSGFIGSIAHSHGRVWAAAASRSVVQGIGIDLERVLDAPAAAELAPSVTTAGERRAAAAAPFEIGLYVTLLFSAKESVYKCLHPLLNAEFGFGDVEAANIDVRTGRMRMRLGAPLGAGFPAGHELEARFEVHEQTVRTAVELAAGA